jgi:hypothetical protein
MTNNPTDWIAAYQAEHAERQAQLSTLKDALLKELASAGVVTVTVEYNGEGDSGQLESIFIEDGNEHRLEILDQEPWREPRIQIENFVWEVLGACHDGFEINDGGYGVLSIDVKARTIELDHNDRVIESLNTQTEL